MERGLEEQKVIDLIRNEVERVVKDGQEVLLLLPGGSAAKLIEPIFESIKALAEKLTISLTDERYVQIGSDDSNWPKIETLQTILPQAKFVPILQGKSQGQTAEDFDRFLQAWTQTGKVVIALFGVGTDGHISGIKPRSPACDSKALACDYQGEDFERVTTTSEFFKHIDLAIIYAEGADKAEVIDKLKIDIDPRAMPAQYIKNSQKYEVIYKEKP